MCIRDRACEHGELGHALPKGGQADFGTGELVDEPQNPLRQLSIFLQNAGEDHAVALGKTLL